MDRSKFLADFANQFDDTDASEIQMDTIFHDLEEWGSLVGMSIIAMSKTQYGKTITGKEIRECVTVEDLFNLIASKE
jgi:acyl carrier protein